MNVGKNEKYHLLIPTILPRLKATESGILNTLNGPLVSKYGATNRMSLGEIDSPFT